MCFLQSAGILTGMFLFPARICPARRFADHSVWIAMAHLVATFDFCKAKDALGNEITPQALFHSGLSRYADLLS